MTVVALGAMLMSAGILSPPMPPAGAMASFRIALERTSTGWAARCDSGCAWQSVTYTCRSSCAIVIDEFGVRGAPGKPSEGAAFSFRLAPEAKGWRATDATGTAWRELAKGCALLPCRAVIDEHGVG